jgi:hypothetical protein
MPVEAAPAAAFEKTRRELESRGATSNATSRKLSAESTERFHAQSQKRKP